MTDSVTNRCSLGVVCFLVLAVEVASRVESSSLARGRIGMHGYVHAASIHVATAAPALIISYECSPQARAFF